MAIGQGVVGAGDPISQVPNFTWKMVQLGLVGIYGELPDIKELVGRDKLRR